MLLVILKAKDFLELLQKRIAKNNSFNSWIDKKRHTINMHMFSRTKIFKKKNLN